MIDIPRGKYIGRRVGDPPKDEAEHFHPLSGLWRMDRLPAKSSSTRVRFLTRRRTNRNEPLRSMDEVAPALHARRIDQSRAGYPEL
jgi:hypothetical protein